MNPQPEKAWALFYSGEGPHRPAFINTYHISPTQQPIREDIGRMHAKSGETVTQGWRRAYREGWRIIRVEVRAL